MTTTSEFHLEEAITHMGKEQVVLITGTVYPRMAKVGYALKAFGLEVILLHCNDFYVQDQQRCFDQVHRYESMEEVLALAKKFSPLVYHVFCVWNYDPALCLLFNGVGPVVLDNYDTLGGMLKTEFVTSRFPQLLDKEKYCIENAAGLCCRDFALNYQKKVLGYAPQGKTLFFPDYCWTNGKRSAGNESQKRTDGFHVVYAGNLNVEKLCRHDPYQMKFKNGFFLEFGRDIASTGIHFHLYPPPSLCRPDEFEDVFSEYLEASATNSFFHIHRPLPVEVLLQEMRQYHLGVEATWLETDTEGSEASKPIRSHYSMSNKLFDYIDSGVGLLLSDNLATRRWFFGREGIVIRSYLDNARQIITSTGSQYWHDLEARVDTAAAKLDITRHVPRLVSFYTSVARSHKQPAAKASPTVVAKSVETDDARHQELFEKLLRAKEATMAGFSTVNAPHVDNSCPINQNLEHQHEASPCCVFVNTYYTAFLDRLYKQTPFMTQTSHEEQKKTLIAQLFGDSDFYSSGLQAAGWTAHEIIVNAAPLQKAWANENGCGGEGLAIAVEQLRRLAPEVVYIQDMHAIPREFLQAIRSFSTLIVGQIASPPGQGVPFDLYDIIVSSFPHYVSLFRKHGITSYYQPLAFDPRIQQHIPKLAYGNRLIDCSFVGGISSMHQKGFALLDYLAQNTSIKFWGYGSEGLPTTSPIKLKHNGEAWGKEMFYLLAASKITVNRHIDAAENYANNMRLFEATGCGALLITDYKDNLNDLFEIGKEVVAYRSPEECAALVNYYLAHPDEAAEIARAGQARTLRDHNYSMRMSQSAEFLSRHLRYHQERDSFSDVDLNAISYGYSPISADDVTLSMTCAWQDEKIPTRQRALVQQQLEQMYRGEVALPFQVLADILKPVVFPGVSILEIGCASGYYYEILEYLLNLRVNYTGVDYSEPLIAMAKDYYPHPCFFAADGSSLFFSDRKFHTVISSCVLLHVTNYRQHIFETARVAGSYIVAARTPVCRQRPTQYFKKMAYGVETVELLFNEQELIREFALNGFRLLKSMEYQAVVEADSYQVTYLFGRG